VSVIERHVKGILFVDYVRMLRSRSDVDWSRHLQPVDLGYLVQRIDKDAWYPMETFERMGLAILAEIAQGSFEMVRFFGRASIDWLCQTYGNLVAPGDPLDTVMRFQVLRRSFFDYAALEIPSIADGEATILVSYQMGDLAEEAASWPASRLARGRATSSPPSISNGSRRRSAAVDSSRASHWNITATKWLSFVPASADAFDG
jgi:hypothetical protein